LNTYTINLLVPEYLSSKYALICKLCHPVAVVVAVVVRVDRAAVAVDRLRATKVQMVVTVKDPETLAETAEEAGTVARVVTVTMGALVRRGTTQGS
jgi:hypothetical protein